MGGGARLAANVGVAYAITVVAALSAAACRSEAPAGATTAKATAASSAPSASASAPSDDPLARAEAAAKKLGGALRGKLEKALPEGGPAKAIEVCAKDAQPTAADVRASTGAYVGRSSTKLRNPVDAPPPWVAEWLTAQAGRKAAEAKPLRAIAQGPTGKVARVILPIGVEAPCLACHGDPAAIAPDVKAAIAARYPTDTATGYAAGDLRGALWAELPVP
jgi:hypothetical protein